MAIKNKLMNNNSYENSPNFILKSRSYSFDIKNSKIKSIKINKDNIKAYDNTTRIIENKIFFNTSNLPKILHKLSLSNNQKCNKNYNETTRELNDTFNRTLKIGFNDIAFSKGSFQFKNINYKINNDNNFKSLNTPNDKIKLKFMKEKLINQYYNNINRNNIFLKYINSNINNEQDKQRNSIKSRNSFNTRTIIINTSKGHNNIINLFTNNKKIKLEKNKNKIIIKEKVGNEEKINYLNEERNSPGINELNEFSSNPNKNEDIQSKYQEQEKKEIDECNKTNENDDDNKERDPRINFELISRVNKSRPQTSYGGLNIRRKNLRSALNKNSRPTTSNYSD